MSVQVKGSGTIGGIDEGLVVSGIVTATELDISGDIDVDGHTNLDNVSIAGVSTFTGTISANNHIELASGKKLSMAGDVFKIYHSTNAAIINESGDLLINQNVSNKDIKISTGSGPTERLRIDSSGKLTLGTTTPSSNAAAYMFTVADPTNSLGNCGITIRSGTGGGSNTNEGSIFFSDATSGSGEYAGYLQYSHVENYFRIGTSSAERFRIASDGVATFSATNINVNRNAGDAFISLQTSGTSNVALYGGASSGFRVFTKPSGGSLTERLRTTSDGRISINDSSPTSQETLTIRPVGNIACDVSLKMNSSTDSRIKFYDSGGTWRGGLGFAEYANSTDYPNFHDSFYFLTDPSSNGSLSTAMRINNAGCFMYPKQPCFSVAMSSDYTSSTTHTANFDTERFDQGNNFNTGSNGIFTAPVTGKYYMHAAIQTMQHGGSQVHIMGVAFLVNGSVQASKGSGDQYLGRNGDHYITVHCIRILNLAQGDTVQVYIQLHAAVRIEGSGGTDRCNWQGYLMA